MNKGWKNWAIIVLLSILMTFLVVIWKGATFPENFRTSSELITQFSTQDLGGMTDVILGLREVAAELGWVELVSQAPFAFIYLFLGSVGLSVFLFVCALLLLTLVYLITVEYSTSKIARLTTLAFALSPLIIKFPLDVLSPFSTGFICLFAVLMAINGMHSPAPTSKMVFWFLFGLACVANYILVEGGIWLPAFIALFMLPSQLTVSQVRLLGIALLVIWLTTGAVEIAGNTLSLNDATTPLRGLLLMPNASQGGYSVPQVFRFPLPGNNPAIILALSSMVMAAREMTRLWTLATLWLLVGIGFNFWLLQAGVEDIFVIFMFPIALLIAKFFDFILYSSRSLVILTLILLFFTIGAAMEPKISEVVLSLQFPGWRTATPFRDLGQILGGLLPVSTFLYIFIQKNLSPRGKSICLNVILAFFGVSQIGLMALL